MNINCPKCKSSIKIDLHTNTDKIKCPLCNAIFSIKSPLGTTSNDLAESERTNTEHRHYGIVQFICIGLCCFVVLLFLFILLQAMSKQTMKKNMKLEQIELESQIQTLSNTISEIQKDKKKKEKIITDLENEKNNFESNIKNLQSEISDFQEDIKENNDKLIKSEQKNEEQLQENIELKGKIEDLNNTIKDLNKTIKELKTSAKYLKSKAIKAFEDGYTLEARNIFQNIFELHPECQRQDEYIKTYKRICDKIAEDVHKRDTEIAAHNAKLMKNIREEYDKMTEKTFYYPTRNCFYVTGGVQYLLEPYMGMTSSNRCFLQLKIAYIDSRGFETRDWIFLEKIQLKGDNGSNIVIETKIWDTDNDVKMGYLKESTDQPITGLVDSFTSLIQARTVSVRFYGKNSNNDFDMTKEQLLALEDILRLYYEKSK
ncbi:MAG: hypothetical protein IJU53_08445 [Thermoguttaceae bacterium]|nr:hypothetical protein [Thermoguttaceae bacterium]